MMLFASPIWLLGLLTVPVIWYLHRRGPMLKRQPVASLELWPESLATAAQPGPRRRPDPVWRQRALVAALLSLALAGPRLHAPAERVTLWVDDSLSMQIAEGGKTRLQRGLDEVRGALSARSVSNVEVHTLSRPWQVWPSPDAALSALPTSAGEHEPRLPDPTRLDPSRSHWLVTDGADAWVNAWLAQSTVSRVFQTAEGSRNVGVAQLSARPQPTKDGGVAVQVILVNGGNQLETRRLQLSVDASLLDAREVSLAPGSTQTLSLAVRTTPSRIGARLTPADALAMDDAAVVDLASLESVATVVDPRCPAAVQRAVDAHPALRRVQGLRARLAFGCPRIEVPGADQVRLLAGQPATVPASEVRWRGGLEQGAPALPSTLPIMTGTGSSPRAGEVVLMEAGGRPLLTLKPGPPRIVECLVDFAAPEFETAKGAPLLLGYLADTALDETLLDRLARSGRGDDASRVLPLEKLSAPGRPVVAADDERSPVLLPLLLLALVVLAWDAIGTVRRLRRDYFAPVRTAG